MGARGISDDRRYLRIQAKLQRRLEIFEDRNRTRMKDLSLSIVLGLNYMGGERYSMLTR